MSTVYASVELIDPETARQYLKKSKGNRKLSPVTLAAYIQDMEHGDWMVSGQGIGFDINGRLVDGHHRLVAIINSGKSVQVLVVRGLPVGVERVTDRNRPRSNADDLRMGGDKFATARAARIRTVGTLFLGNGGCKLTATQSTRLMTELKNEIDWSLETIPRARKTGQAPVGGAFAFAYRSNPGIVAQFASRFTTMGFNSPDDPARTLFELVNDAKISRHDSFSLSVKTLRCIKAAIDNEGLKKVQMPKTPMNIRKFLDFFRSFYPSEIRNIVQTTTTQPNLAKLNMIMDPAELTNIEAEKPLLSVL